jgi:hypothetical protein
LGLTKGEDFKTIGLEQSADRPSHGWIIVDQTDQLLNGSAGACLRLL